MVRLKSLKDLLLRDPDCIFKYRNKFFTSIVAEHFAVFWITEDNTVTSGFVKLDKNLNVSVLKLPKFGHIPIIEVGSLSVINDEQFLEELNR